MGLVPATLPKCREFLKLLLPPGGRKAPGHLGVPDPGAVKMQGMLQWIICSLLLRALGPREGVQRLDGSGLGVSPGLRQSLPRVERPGPEGDHALLR